MLRRILRWVKRFYETLILNYYAYKTHKLLWAHAWKITKDLFFRCLWEAFGVFVEGLHIWVNEIFKISRWRPFANFLEKAMGGFARIYYILTLLSLMDFCRNDLDHVALLVPWFVAWVILGFTIFYITP